MNFQHLTKSVKLYPMRKSLLAILACVPVASFAQAGTDTLIWENFETDPASFLQMTFPPGTMNDPFWYNWDNDALADQSGAGRPGEWYWGTPFADGDTVGNAGVLHSNSWTNDGINPVMNWLITPSIFVTDTTFDLFWKSAPYQTPRFLDGYIVVLSTGTNDFADFTDTLFVGSEYVSLDVAQAPFQYSSYTFSPMSGFIHGFDQTYIEDNAGDSARWVGMLRPFTADLSSYVGLSVYIGFVHYTTDDNLFSIDDIFLEGTGTVGVPENTGAFPMGVYPNPATDVLNVNYTLPAESEVMLNIYSIDGTLVRSENKGSLATGSGTVTTNVADLAPGVYMVQLQTEAGVATKRIVIQ